MEPDKNTEVDCKKTKTENLRVSVLGKNTSWVTVFAKVFLCNFYCNYYICCCCCCSGGESEHGIVSVVVVVGKGVQG